MALKKIRICQMFNVVFLLLVMSGTRGTAQTVVKYQPSSAIFPNPERGFYTHREVQAEGAMLTLSDVNGIRAKSQSLILRLYYLKKFRTSDLSAAQLNLIQNDFNIARQGGVKLILRFAYSSSESESDAPLSTILRHLDQLKPIFEANSDPIACVQAGWIGAWGEWYYSTNNLNNTNDRRTVLKRFLEVLPNPRSVQVRTPFYKKDIFLITDPLTPEEAFSGTNIARTGHHNDCFLASADDYGTYRDNVADKLFLSLDTRFLPMGGETCALSTYSNAENAAAQFAKMHWSFLNSDYNKNVLNSWRTSFMDTVKQQLGYRFELLSGTYQDSVAPGSGYNFTIFLRNVGWASPFNARPVEVFLRRLGDSTKYLARLSDNPCFWLPGDTITIGANIQVPWAAKESSYELLLNFPDPSPTLYKYPAFSIRLANQDVWDPSSGYNKLLQTVVVTTKAKATPVTGALVFKPTDGTTGVIGAGSTVTGDFRLVGNYPNPFNPATTISYILAKPTRVRIEIVDVLGRVLESTLEQEQGAGEHHFPFSAHQLAGGVYFYVVRAGAQTATGRMILLK